jgi:hypothetical protein
MDGRDRDVEPCGRTLSAASGSSHTFASVLVMIGRDPAYVMSRFRHTDPAFTLRVSAQVLARKRIDQELVWSLMRFSDEPDEWPGGRNRTTIGTTEPLAPTGAPGGPTR